MARLGWGIPLLALIAFSSAFPDPAHSSPVLEQLDFPREQPAALERARRVLEEALRSAGIEPRIAPFRSRPSRAPVAGALLLVGAAGLCVAARWRPRACLAGAATGAGLALLVLIGAFDRLLPARPETNLVATIEPRGAPRSEILLTAHYDSKTEWLDHVERGVLFGATCAAAFGGLVGLLLRRRTVRFWAIGTALGLGACGIQLASSRWLHERSHGIVDDAAACDLLVELATSLREAPLESTRVQCIFFGAEELGAQGSSAYVQQIAAKLPNAVINLECLGAGPRLGVALHEWTGRSIAAAPRELVASLDAAASAPGATLVRLRAPVATDAGPWRCRGVAAVTLLGMSASGSAPRHLHGPGDSVANLEARGVEAARVLLRGWLGAWDAKAAGDPLLRPSGI